MLVANWNVVIGTAARILHRVEYYILQQISNCINNNPAKKFIGNKEIPGKERNEKCCKIIVKQEIGPEKFSLKFFSV